MAHRNIGSGAAVLVALLVAGCSGGGSGERQGILRTIGLRQPPPDEFMVVERKPLEMPPSYVALPPPTPEGTNLVDPQPRREVAALLSNAGAASTTRGAMSVGEQELVAATGPVDPGIRQTMSAENQRVLAGNNYYGLEAVFGRLTPDPYIPQRLDAEAEAQRLRQEGVVAPASPIPDDEDEDYETVGDTIRLL